MPDISASNRRIAKNTLYLYIRMFILLFVGFYTTRVILETLGVDDFGLYNVIAGFVAMISFVNTSISNSIQRFLNFEIGKGEAGNFNKYFSVSLTTQIIISCSILLLGETVGLWFVNDKLNIPQDRYGAANIVYQISILTTIVNVFRSPFQAVIIANEKMEFYAYQSLIEAFLQLGIAFLLKLVYYRKIELYSALLLAVAVCILILNIIYSRKIQKGLSLRPSYDSKIFKEVFSFCGWNLFGSASGVISNQGINMLINVFWGVTTNAARGVATQVYGGVQKFSANFQLAMNPQIVQSYAGKDYTRYLNLCYANFKISVYLIWIIILPLIVCCDDVLSLWLGPNIPDQTGLFVIVILLTGLVEALGSSISVPLYATGNIKKYQVCVSLIKIAAIPIAYFVYKGGGPAISSMVILLSIDIVAQVVRVLIWTQEVKSSALLYVKRIVAPLVLIMIITFVPSFLLYGALSTCSRLLRLVIIIIVSLAVNFPAIIFVALDKNERRMVWNAFKVKLVK